MTSPASCTGTVRITGTSLERGFFFIRGDDGLDYFGHVGELRGELNEETLRHGDLVTFIPTKIPKGWKANEIYLDHAAQDVRGNR
jgi:cold shock CspA family protein